MGTLARTEASCSSGHALASSEHPRRTGASIVFRPVPPAFFPTGHALASPEHSPVRGASLPLSSLSPHPSFPFIHLLFARPRHSPSFLPLLRQFTSIFFPVTLAGLDTRPYGSQPSSLSPNSPSPHPSFTSIFFPITLAGLDTRPYGSQPATRFPFAQFPLPYPLFSFFIRLLPHLASTLAPYGSQPFTQFPFASPIVLFHLRYSLLSLFFSFIFICYSLSPLSSLCLPHPSFASVFIFFPFPTRPAYDTRPYGGASLQPFSPTQSSLFASAPLFYLIPSFPFPLYKEGERRKGRKR